MRRFLLTIPLVGLVFMASGSAGAWPGKSEKKVEKKIEAAPAVAPTKAAAPVKADVPVKAAAPAGAVDPLRAERERVMRDWQASLGSSRWDLEVTLSSGRPPVVQSDVLTFQHGTMSSDTLTKAGYGRAPYSLYPPEEKSIAWEAMQRKEKDGAMETAIWRGEVTGETMQGTLFKRITKGDKETVETFSFTGRRVADAPEPAAQEVVVPAAESAPTAPPAPAVQAPAAPAPSQQPSTAASAPRRAAPAPLGSKAY